MVTDFWTWLLRESRQQQWVPQGVLQSYDAEFRRQMERLIQRTADPKLRAKFIEQLGCPVRDSRGNCRSFTEYIVAALIRNGVQDRYDVEAALGYVVEKMLLDKTDTGEERTTLFGGFAERPDIIEGNPLQARFMKFLQFAVNNIRKGRIPRLAQAAHRPEGTVSIGLGRARKDEPSSGLSPDMIPARPSGDADLSELVADITALLRRKEQAISLPLVNLFQTIMAGERTEQQARKFGDRQTRQGRQVIVQVIRDYARSTGNYVLLNMLKRFEDFQSNKPLPPARMTKKVVRPKLTDKERDFASIVSVIDRFGGRPVGSAELGKYRRRWLEYQPRIAGSGHRNRLEEVLASMAQDGVLTATTTSRGAVVYSPGPRFEEYHRAKEGGAATSCYSES